MSDWLSALLGFLAPVLIGAAIGFITNDIAIRMLFRPLTEKRLFGIRVPFTPGIIPKQRRNLASSIGRMVSDELLTEDSVRAQVESPRVQEALRENIGGLTDSLLGLRLEEVAERRLPVFQATLPEILKGFLGAFLKSQLFLTALENLVNGFLDSLGGKKVREVAAALELEKFLHERITSLIEEDAFKNRIAAAAVDWARRQGKHDAPLESFASDGLVTAATALFRSAFPHILDALRDWLDAPEVRRNLEVKGKLLLDDILSKLNIFQRFFVSVGQYDRTLSDQMPEIVSDLIDRVHEAVRTDEEREGIVQAFGRALQGWRRRGVGELLPESEEELQKKIALFVDRAFQFLRKEKLGDKLAGAVGEYLVKREDDTVAHLADSLLGLKKERITAFILERFTRDDFIDRAAERVTGFALDFFKGRGQLTLGELLGVDREQKAAFDGRAVAALNRVLGDKLPEALRSLDLRGLVENKINALDIRAVEGLLLMVIAKQLKWINVFGAILGAIIGLVQVILRLAGIG